MELCGVSRHDNQVGPLLRRLRVSTERQRAHCSIRAGQPASCDDPGRLFSGASFNVYDRGSASWHQTWVDNSGTLLRLDGGLVEGRMVLESHTTSAGGVATAHRITWTPNGDGSDRQHWEATNAAGDRTKVFDGLYTRVAESVAPSR